ncbi:MAG: dual specificity protein phosphatase family protein [bacterium]|nr:dual specificity protein phosphatase family protein [bacterium]MCY3632555.1 dual specificity protein phosphatase family protein [bacterium]
MQVGAARYQMAGGIHRIPVPSAAGSLHATAFAVTGPDPAAALEDVGAEVMVCLLTDSEIAMRFPDYPAWLADPAPHQALHVPMVDQGVTGDDTIRELVDDINQHLDQGTGVMVHCGAGYGRAGIVCISVLTSRGMDLDDAVAAVRAARPAAGPQSHSQEAQITRLATGV